MDTWTNTVAAALVIVVITVGGRIGWWHFELDKSLVVTTLIAALGLLLGKLLTLIRRPPNKKPDDDDATDNAKSETEEKNEDNVLANSAWVQKYNEVVRRHNRVVESRLRWISYANAEHTRAELLRLNSRAFRVAIYFSVWSALAALLKPIPARVGAPGFNDAAMQQQLLLILGAILVPASLVGEVAKIRLYSVLYVVSRVALLGMFGCAFISLAVTLPYRYEELLNTPDPSWHFPILYSILIWRLVIFPTVGFFSATVTAVSIRSKAKARDRFPSGAAAPIS